MLKKIRVIYNFLVKIAIIFLIIVYLGNHCFLSPFSPSSSIRVLRGSYRCCEAYIFFLHNSLTLPLSICLFLSFSRYLILLFLRTSFIYIVYIYNIYILFYTLLPLIYILLISFCFSKSSFLILYLVFCFYFILFI